MPFNFELMSKNRTSAYQHRRLQPLAAMKLRQATSIRQIADALRASGFYSLDKQARALGVARSTAWTILKSAHKSSGLSAKLINRMLAGQHLPPLVRTKILDYVQEKAAGDYGHNSKLRNKFVTALAATSDTVQLQKVANEVVPRTRLQKRTSAKPMTKRSDRPGSNGGLSRARGAV